jgi:predicted SAM-dependent methyltransferase
MTVAVTPGSLAAATVPRSIRLNIACATNVFPDWWNLDRVDFEDAYLRHLRGLNPDQILSWAPGQRELVHWLNEGRIKFKVKDLREGFAEFPDGSVDAVYLGQMAEHLHPHTELPKFLAECHRMLKPGGRVRITTPDMKRILQAYNEGRMGEFAAEQPDWFAAASPEAQLSFLLFGASGDDCTRESYDGHFHCWTVDDLCSLLVSVGFAEASEYREPTAVFADCRDFGLSHSMALEARK